MKIAILNKNDLYEISFYIMKGFWSTFPFIGDESDSDIEKDSESDSSDLSDSSDTDLNPLDLGGFECGEITEEIEEMVSEVSSDCVPLEMIYGDTAAGIIKETIKSSTEETQCVGIRILGKIIPPKEENENLHKACTETAFWCCCETLKRVSPIIAEATVNLLR